MDRNDFALGIHDPSGDGAKRVVQEGDNETYRVGLGFRVPSGKRLFLLMLKLSSFIIDSENGGTTI